MRTLNRKIIATVRESYNFKREKIIQSGRGITLIALIITIIVLLILAGVALNFVIGENGILKQAEVAEEKTNKQTATEKMNLKITTAQMNTYAEEQRMPTLQEFADKLCEDNEIQYVELQSKKVASLSKIDVGEAESIFTKLKEYPYEFEINSSLQLASIDGVKVAIGNTENTTTACNPKLLTSIVLPSTGANTRATGTYYANESSFTKTNTNDFDNYLSFDATKGWTVLKSGNYMINSYIAVHYKSAIVDTNNLMDIDEGSIWLNSASIRKANDYIRDTNNINIYLEKGTVINFNNKIASGEPAYHSAQFKIYALFK